MEDRERPDLYGLGGWLILVGIGVVVGPLRLIWLIVSVYVPIFNDGTWQVLTTEGSGAYHPAWGPLLLGEMAFNTGMLLASIYLAVLYFTKHRFFPKLFILLTAISLVFIPLDAWLVSIVLPSEPIFDEITIREFVRTIVAAAIWVPYMLVSIRVKQTFVNPIQEPGTPQDQYISGSLD